jgi:hypothetical protein
MQSGEGGAGSPAWSASVRSHLYFDWVRDRSGPVDDTRVLSRKKANYSKVHRPGDGVFLARGEDWTFRIAPRPKPPETPKAKREREATAEAINHLFIVRKAAMEYLEARPAKAFSTRRLTEALEADVGLSNSTVRRWLAKLAKSEFPHFQRGEWVCITPVAK